MTHGVVYVGGPRHGEREARPGHPLDAPPRLAFPTLAAGVRGQAHYRREAQADTPGAIAYVHTERISELIGFT